MMVMVASIGQNGVMIIMNYFDEYKLQVQQLYDEYLMKAENRNISYGEIAWIQSLKEKELTEFENELERVVYGG